MSQTRKQKVLEDVKRARRRRTLATSVIVAVLMVGIVVAAILLTGHSPTPPTPNGLIGAPISTALYNQLNGVSDSTLLTAQPDPGVVTPLKSESGPLLTFAGKTEVLYIGAEYCPYCAAERWSLVVALSKFGSFSGLTYMQSARQTDQHRLAFAGRPLAHRRWLLQQSIIFRRQEPTLQSLRAKSTGQVPRGETLRGLPRSRGRWHRTSCLRNERVSYPELQQLQH